MLKNAKLIIWDESTMASKFALQVVNSLLQEIMQTDVLFGGKTFLLGGNFRQTLSVVPHGSRSVIVESSIKFFTCWDAFHLLRLHQNIRSVEPAYSDWILKMGNGEMLDSDGLPQDVIEIPKEIIATSIVEEIFGISLESFDTTKALSCRAILCPENDDALKINNIVSNIITGEETTYLSVDDADCAIGEDRVNYPVEYLNTLHPSGMPPHELILKKGCIIMLLRNLNSKRGLCNGTRLIATKLSKNLIVAEVLTGSAQGETLFIPRIELAQSVNDDLPFTLRRRQFP